LETLFENDVRKFLNGATHTTVLQGAYNSGKPGKPGKLREFVNSGKLRKNSGNLMFSQGIYQMFAVLFVTVLNTEEDYICLCTYVNCW